MSECLTDEVLGRIQRGALAEETLAQVRLHALGCPGCLLLLDQAEEQRRPRSQKAPDPPATAFATTDPGGPRHPVRIPWQPPRSFDDLELVELVGKGGMGAVYRAKDVQLGRTVAVKFISTPDPDEALVRRFRLEAQAEARLSHPNLVSIFRVGEIEGRPYLVSEWAEGRRLDALPRPMAWQRALKLGLGLSRGLAAAHRKRILHRDIKPGNVVVQDDDEIKIIDFGLAKLLDGPPTPALQTEAGTRLGTLRYMAPEVFHGHQAGYASDVCSLGLVLYELCAGDLPRALWTEGAPSHAGGDPQADQDDEDDEEARLQAEHMPPLLTLAPTVSPEFAAIVDRCVRHAPAERYATGDAVREALERLTPFLRTSALPQGNPYRGLRPFEAEHRALFFGRSGDIRAVLDRLRADPLVLVVGDSGVGKSSLCRAGVVPCVLDGALGGRMSFSTLSMLPGRHPVSALGATMAPVLRMKEAALTAWMRADPSALGHALREGQRRHAAVLLFVDQAEELLTLSAKAEAALFVQILGELLLPSPSVRVLMTVRGDFLTRLATLEGLREVVQRSLYLLGPLTREGLREAIVEPARSQGVRFEPESVADSAALGPGGLPLLQFALAELWEARDRARGSISAQTLEALGGVAGALSLHADGVLGTLLAAQRRAARGILCQLVSEAGTRTRRGESELGLHDETTRRALQALVDGRLIFASQEDGEPAYELAHEVLIRSWPTLRSWLDADAGKRAILGRVSTAAAEWERLRRSRDALWSRRQLAEVAGLDPQDLPARDAAFLAASRRAVLTTRLALLGAMVLLAALVGGQWVRGRMEARREVRAALQAAGAERAVGQRIVAQAAALRAGAYALFDRLQQPGEEQSIGRDRADVEWARALELEEQADSSFARAGRILEQALLRDLREPSLRGLLADVLFERIALADGNGRRRPRGDLLERLSGVDDSGERRRRMLAPMTLRIECDPPGAQAAAQRYVESGGAVEPGPERYLGACPIRGASLEPGSWLIDLRAQGRPPVRYPLVATAGDAQDLRIEIPPAVPAGYLYVPAGEFLFGADEEESIRTAMTAPPQHRARTEGYLIGQSEVTVAEWIEFLQSLPPREQRLRRPEGADRRRQHVGIALRPDAGHDGAWEYLLYEGGHEYRVRTGERLRYPQRKLRAEQDWTRFPVTGVAPDDVEAYLRWLDRTGRLPGARLCDEREWERAARGADGRRYPLGKRVLRDDANFDETYFRRPLGFGPDEVGSHLRSDSPFGVHDMLGNAWELVRSVQVVGEIVIRGGSWYQDQVTCHLANREVLGEQTFRLMDAGVRVCASLDFHGGGFT